MRHVQHAELVDPHAQRDGANHVRNPTLLPRDLELLAFSRREPRVVVLHKRRPTFSRGDGGGQLQRSLQQRGQPLCFRTRGRVDEPARVCRVLGEHKLAEQLILVRPSDGRHNSIAHVQARSGATVHVRLHLVDAEHVGDGEHHLGRRSGREQQPRQDAQDAEEGEEQEVGPKGLAVLEDTVRLVDHHARERTSWHARAQQEVQRLAPSQLLGGREHRHGQRLAVLVGELKALEQLRLIAARVDARRRVRLLAEQRCAHRLRAEQRPVLVPGKGLLRPTVQHVRKIDGGVATVDDGRERRRLIEIVLVLPRERQQRHHPQRDVAQGSQSRAQ